MKGNNTLELNLATVMEAMQEWLDKRLPHTPQRVIGFQSLGGTCPLFRLNVEDVKVTPDNGEVR